tara:strand:- start:300 stop:1661 length:1362 start_codon:yes stop_codon:yes gene_type:complete
VTSDQKHLLIKKIDATLMQAMLESINIPQLLKIAQQYGHFHWFNLTDRWENKAVENHIFKLVLPHLENLTRAKNPTKVTHVMSEGHNTGGHTPLCLNIVKEQKSRGREVEIFITKRATQKVIEEIKQSGITLKSFPDDGLPKLLELSKQFLQSKAIVLHINPNDIIATLAAMLAERNGIPCFFVNHANIHFSYGPAQCSAVLEITAASWLSTAKYRTPKSQSFLGIPAATVDRTTLTALNLGDLKPDHPYFVSVGTKNKYRLNSDTQFIDFVEFLCGQKKQKLLIVGPGDAPSFQTLSEAARKNLTVLGPTERQTTLALMANAIAYIDSFPEGGGSSVVNAMSLGLPIFGHRISEGMYGDEFLSPSMEDLFERVSHFIENGPDTAVVQERSDFIHEHMSIQACVDRLESTIDGENCPIPFDYSKFDMDLDFHHRAWLQTDNLIVPPIIKINQA